MNERSGQSRREWSAASSHPVRACLSGEDLDWLGGKSVCVALDLHTTVRADDPGAGEPEGDGIPVEPWATQVWTYLRERVPGMAAEPPGVVASTRAPSASGLSSSTALILGLFEIFAGSSPACAGIPLSILVQWAYEFEFTIFNGGGMDHVSITRGGATLFQGRSRGLPVLAEQMAFPAEWALLVVDSGMSKNTQDHVRSVRRQEAAGDPALARYMRVANDASEAVWSAIRSRELVALGEGMELAHTAMRDHQGMSTPFLEQLRDIAWATAWVRLKLSGAGGGGALVAVCARADAASVSDALRSRYGAVFPGVRVHLVDAVAPRDEW
ncbi:galactokinase [Saccharopolyspora phatthalungensis]|uniref:Galactokinase n=1 Tax=Saccharopolyspora phatthalungensis TaxID=664693 RepID=A0A840QHA5_9PSEU|nr:galactokinase [Saccharopolyspora phatthalungensis]MBB5159537.1 galactokinase [Saccharopolyspora phatthalungensis]